MKNVLFPACTTGNEWEVKLKKETLIWNARYLHYVTQKVIVSIV
jgi:hypothetical protein